VLTTLLNPVAVVIAAALAATVVSGRRGFDTVRDAACHPAALTILGVLAVLSIGSRIVVGYFVPGDIAQEVVAATRFDATGTLYSDRIAADVQTWMITDPPPFENRLPATIQARFRAERDAQARLYSAQAHPPFLLLCARPLVQLSGGYGAFLVVTSLTLAATAVATAVLLDWAGVARFSRAWWLVVALALAWQPTLAATRHGQVSAVVSALVIGAWALARRGRDSAAGVAAGIAAALKVYPVIFFLLLLIRRPRACLAAIVTVVAATMLVVMWAGGASLHAYAVSARAIAADFGTTGNNYSLASRLGLLGLRDTVWPALAATALAVTTLVALVATRGRVRSFDRAAAACVCLLILASPIAWQHYFFVLLLPVFVIGRDAYRNGSQWALGLWLVGVLALSIPDAPYWWVVTHLASPAALVLSPTLVILAGWAWCLRPMEDA
jgi:hypothetical protein